MSSYSTQLINDTTSRKRQRSPPLPATSDPGSSEISSERRTRRRAPIACQVCRSRKVKCSNERPTCAGCARLGRECVYPDSAGQGLHMSVLDEDSSIVGTLREILKRLPPVSTIEEDTEHVSPLIRSHRDLPATLPANAAHATGQAATDFASLFGRSPSPPTVGDSISTSPSFTSLDFVFQWPIFRGSPTHRFTPANVLITGQPSQDGSRDTIFNGQAGAALPSFDGEEIITLLRKFLRLVHTKNPVLDCNTLLSSGRTLGELGPQWDTKTCLVLVSAALGAIVTLSKLTQDTAESLSSSSSRIEDLQARRKAEAYYQYARRRFGLLDRSLTACHCHLISGIYLLYTLRPAQAWQAFFDASNLYTLYLRSREAAKASDEYDLYSQDKLRCQLEQLLYWSCIKSESEICTEITLPRSNLCNIEYPYLFPSPPTPKRVDEYLNGSVGDDSNTIMPESGSHETQDFKIVHEESWLYHLSEIAMLRLSNRLNHTFYKNRHTSWTAMNLLNMMTAAWNYEKQLQQWQASLPSAISWFEALSDPRTITELQLLTWSRYSSIRLRLYRPFLYRLAHPQDQDWPLKDTLRQFAEKAVLTSLEPLWAVGLRHRAASTWYKCRETAVSALVLLCARKIGLLASMRVEEQAEEMVRLCVAHLRYWEDEARDIARARQVIEEMDSSS